MPVYYDLCMYLHIYLTYNDADTDEIFLRSVNFGETLIKEMIMCRYFFSKKWPHLSNFSLQHVWDTCLDECCNFWISPHRWTHNKVFVHTCRKVSPSPGPMELFSLFIEWIEIFTWRIANNLETFGTLPKFDQNSLLKVLRPYIAKTFSS